MANNYKRWLCDESLKTPLFETHFNIFWFRRKPSLITVICMDPHSPNKLFMIICDKILRDETTFFFFISLFFAFLLLYVIINFYKNYIIIIILFYFFHENNFIFSCSRMFRNVLACSGMPCSRFYRRTSSCSKCSICSKCSKCSNLRSGSIFVSLWKLHSRGQGETKF